MHSGCNGEEQTWRTVVRGRRLGGHLGAGVGHLHLEEGVQAEWREPLGMMDGTDQTEGSGIGMERTGGRIGRMDIGNAGLMYSI